jgi:hypothetical protein
MNPPLPDDWTFGDTTLITELRYRYSGCDVGICHSFWSREFLGVCVGNYVCPRSRLVVGGGSDRIDLQVGYYRASGE